jgi:hypothetical protein
MNDDTGSTKIAMVLLFAFLLQVVFIIADNKQTPYKAAIDFSKAYFSIDEKMYDLVCSDLAGDGEDSTVTAYFRAKADEARNRGFTTDQIKNSLYHIRTDTISKDDASARVRITGLKRVAINPLYLFVCKIFNIGKTHHVDEIIDIVYEDGAWKVCGSPYSLTGKS